MKEEVSQGEVASAQVALEEAGLVVLEEDPAALEEVFRRHHLDCRATTLAG